MADREISSDPADYISGPTGLPGGNGGTNRSGGVTVSEPDDSVQTTQTAPPAQPAESTPAPAPAAGGDGGQQQTAQQQQAGAQGAS